MNRTGLGRAVRVAAVAAAVIGAAVPTAGCGVFGSGIDQETPVAMTVSSGAVVQNMMDERFTCSARADAVHPPLGWAGAPPGTKSLALVIDDSGAPITPWVYWIVFNIDPATSQIFEGQVPPGARVARNSAGAAGYEAPCPGPRSHSYRFTVYALNRVLNLPSGTSLQSAWSQIADATIGRGRLTASATSDTP